MERPYLAPLVRSVAAPGGRLMPARSHGVENADAVVEESDVTGWSPYTGLVRAASIIGQAFAAPLRGTPPIPRPAVGTAYVTPDVLWNLAGVASGWSSPFAPNPVQPVTARVALGKWTPMGGAQAPLPTLPEPQRMVQPGLG